MVRRRRVYVAGVFSVAMLAALSLVAERELPMAQEGRVKRQKAKVRCEDCRRRRMLRAYSIH
jgi:hypothetical protein